VIVGGGSVRSLLKFWNMDIICGDIWTLGVCMSSFLRLYLGCVSFKGTSRTSRCETGKILLSKQQTQHSYLECCFSILNASICSLNFATN